jgi:hypothetical protein
LTSLQAGYPNSINLRSRGRIPVGILSTAEFDVRLIDPRSVRFGKTGNENTADFCHEEDIDLDGSPDLVCHFAREGTGFQTGDPVGVLKGETTTGVPIIGQGSINVVPR